MTKFNEGDIVRFELTGEVTYAGKNGIIITSGPEGRETVVAYVEPGLTLVAKGPANIGDDA